MTTNNTITRPLNSSGWSYVKMDTCTSTERLWRKMYKWNKIKKNVHYNSSWLCITHLVIQGPKIWDLLHPFQNKLRFQQYKHRVGYPDPSAFFITCTVIPYKILSLNPSLFVFVFFHVETQIQVVSRSPLPKHVLHYYKRQRGQGIPPLRYKKAVMGFLSGDFWTLYNHVILDHRQWPLSIFPKW